MKCSEEIAFPDWESETQQNHSRLFIVFFENLDAMIAIRSEFPEARIIIRTTYTGDVQVLRAMKVGAQA